MHIFSTLMTSSNRSINLRHLSTSIFLFTFVEHILAMFWKICSDFGLWMPDKPKDFQLGSNQGSEDGWYGKFSDALGPHSVPYHYRTTTILYCRLVVFDLKSFFWIFPHHSTSILYYSFPEIQSLVLVG